jgi:hypothetical protein
VAALTSRASAGARRTGREPLLQRTGAPPGSLRNAEHFPMVAPARKRAAGAETGRFLKAASNF